MLGIGTGFSQCAVQGQGAGGWSPAQLLQPGSMLRDLTRLNRAYTDPAGLIPAAPGQPVAALRDGTGAVVATQANAAARPVLGVMPASGLRQRLTRSEDMSDGWLPDGVTLTEVSIAPPPGLSRVWEVRETATPAGHRVRASGVTVAAGRTYTSSIFARAGSVSSLHVAHFDQGGAWSGSATFDLAAGTTTAPATSSITSVGGGWYRCAVTTGVAAAASGNGLIIWGLRGTGSYPGDADQFMYLSGRMNEVGNAVTPYQNAMTSLLNVTEAGQRSLRYLQADGIDDWMGFAAFAPTGAYSLALAAAGFSGAPAGNIFGGASAPDTRYAALNDTAALLRANGTGNQVLIANLASSLLRHVDVVRVSTAQSVSLWRNGVAASPGMPEGGMIPLSPLDALFRQSGGYGAGRFFGGLLINRAISDAERGQIQRYLAARSGAAVA